MEPYEIECQAHCKSRETNALVISTTADQDFKTDLQLLGLFIKMSMKVVWK